MPEPDISQSSRNRLLAAGKSLFSRLGYEQASTSAIARDAGTSESQLIRYFGGKSGLLEAIFNEAWAALNDDITRHLEESAHGRDAILRILGLVLDQFGRDQQMAFLFMFEGRRIRGNEVALSKGFLKFYELLHELIRRGQSDGSFRDDITSDLLASALLGAAEGMMRDRMIGERIGQPRAYDDDAIRRTFEGIVNGLAAGPPS